MKFQSQTKTTISSRWSAGVTTSAVGGLVLQLLLLSHKTPLSNAAFYMSRPSRLDYAASPRRFEDEPVLVEEFLKTSSCEPWLEHIFQDTKDEHMQIHRGTGQNLWRSPMLMSDAVKKVLDTSSHREPIYLATKGKSCSIEGLPLRELLQEMLDNEEAKSSGEFDDDNMDWFPFFEKHVPVDDSLVICGEGSSSPVLQCHPFTKYILCIDGSQLIRIHPPLTEQMNPAIRQAANPILSEAGNVPISLGYHATPNLSLFSFRHKDVNPKTYLENDLRKGVLHKSIYDVFQQWAEDPSKFHPNFAFPQDPRTMSNHNLWHSGVAVAGDLVVIPPGWWYQTYNLEASVSLQTQRCVGTQMATGFIHHMLEAAGVGRNLQLEPGHHHTKQEAQEIVDEAFGLVEEHLSRMQGGGNGPGRFQGRLGRDAFEE